MSARSGYYLGLPEELRESVERLLEDLARYVEEGTRSEGK